MTLDQILLTATTIIWRQPALWALGLLATLGGLLFAMSTRLLFLGRPPPAIRLDQYNHVGTILERASPAVLIGGVLVFCLAMMIFWLLNVIAEGGLIIAVKGNEEGQPVGIMAAVRAGFGLVGRFIGIDTLLFLPLLLLTLALMLVGFVGLAGLAFAATRPGAQIGDLLLVIGLSTAIGVPIMLLTVITVFLTLLLRTLAFRAGALEGLTSSESIKRAVIVLRQQTLPITLMALVLWALRSLVGMPLRFVALVLVAVQVGQYVSAAASPFQILASPEPLLAVAGLVVALLSSVLAAIMSAYGSTSWTLAYGQWTDELV